ncbi:CoA transferase subunit A [Pseudonocardia sp. RS010]|uniref:CoA transferase subunit A n=1 Tax=Pseudonocardia sp. RS010 TaxID=3385979 RepID=UPI0039A21286
MATTSPLADAVDALVHDGAEIALEGSGASVPAAAVRAILRRRPRDLTLVGTVPGPAADQLVGAGCVKALVFARLGPDLHRIRDALVTGWPAPLEIEEHSQAGMAARYVAGASGLPFATVRGGGTGSDLAAVTRTATVRCPFTGEELTALPALRPDLAVVHARRADRTGNVQLHGVPGLRKEAVLAARTALVTVEEVVDELEPEHGAPVLPAFAVTRIAVVPAAARDHEPSSDGGGQRTWSAVSGDRARFTSWLEEIRA